MVLYQNHRVFLVRLKGLEPPRRKTREPKSRMSANSITGAKIKASIFTRRGIRGGAQGLTHLWKEPIANAIGS